jgi:hypothetical protein
LVFHRHGPVAVTDTRQQPAQPDRHDPGIDPVVPGVYRAPP